MTVDQVTYRGRLAVRVRTQSSADAVDDAQKLGTGGGIVLIEGSSFHDGTIEVDVAGRPQANAPVAYSVVSSVLRFPYALVLGFAAGAMEFIPVVGPLVAALVIVFVGFLTTYPHLWSLVLFFALWRVVQDYFVSPRVMGGTLKVHPLAAIAAVLMGAELGGVLGVYLSIPVAATIRIVWVRWQKYSAVIATAAAQGDIPESNVK